MEQLQSFLIKIVILILFMVVIIGCTNNNRSDHKKYIKKYYLNGELKKEGYFINGTIPVDTIKVYNKNGHLISLHIYNYKGELTGVCLYYKNGVTKQQRSYLNGKLNGICRNFYKNGNIESVSYFFNGIQVGDAKFYFEDGGISLYNFFDFSGRNRIVREYNPSGKEITNIGNKLFIDSSFAINDTLVAIDTFKVAILISHPPRTRLSIHIEELDSAKNILRRLEINKKDPLVFLSLPISKNLHNVKIICSQFDSVNTKNKVLVTNTILK